MGRKKSRAPRRTATRRQPPETLASAAALALLRVCSVLGPATTRSAARESANRLAATGLAERPWARMPCWS